MNKLCPIIGCANLISVKRILCHGHWGAVPAPLQKTLWRLWREGAPLAGYSEAHASAVEQVEAKMRARV